MPARTCAHCQTARALILRPKDHTPLCKPCFISIFELEIHRTITSHSLFSPAEHVAIGASGGKDSTVLASVLCTLNARHNYGLRLHLLSIDEGITGYRDHSLDAVRRQAARLELPLTIVGYKELYGWSMDEVVKETGRKGNCTYCGVFRRQALDRGAASLGIRHVVTGHNADDIAETVVMNLLRGDLPRLSRATRIVTGTGGTGEVKRSKPLKYAYEKEIVLYAHHMKLEYFSTECIYSPEAFRGSARALIKNLERIRPSSILDVVRSGEDMAKLVPAEVNGSGVGSDVRVDSTRRRKFEAEQDEDEETGGCGTGPTGRSSGGEMADMEKKLAQNEQAVEEELEFEVTQEAKQFDKARHQASEQLVSQKVAMQKTGPERTARRLPTQTMGRCARCGYLSSQSVCKACALLEGLNKNRPKTGIEVGDNSLVHGVQLDDSLNRRLGAIGISIQPDKNAVPG